MQYTDKLINNANKEFKNLALQSRDRHLPHNQLHLFGYCRDIGFSILLLNYSGLMIKSIRDFRSPPSIIDYLITVMRSCA